MNLLNRVALITGGGRGIGRAIALKFADLGADIIINDIAGSEGAPQVVAEVEAKGRKATYIPADISKADDVTALISKSIEAFEKIDILVNNAGITRDKLIVRMSDDDWDLVLNINLKGAFLCTREVLKHMMRQRSGRIVSLASVVGLMGNGGQANYSASKAGIIALTKSTAKEAAPRGITANAIAPGFIDTEMTSHLKEEVKQLYEKQIPLGHYGKPEDIANAAAFLASDEAGYITGQVLSVNGGMLMP
ncbi:MAG: 3-oxoacyl-[acyl-carrier-protein] reductase [Chloroflexi bacterium]|jgi:3-oxoacyl-[acyl-carrier protein] reductase|nr:3-oxoacyl-[acyl-carrier-protein] reductase [Chloroflexota bacterium]MBT7081354.1 3-oxoacyl-[acyl-carrier-protein] reductase [Chloroflexota bacterium]MBT7290662.1 3-oxoacyl-[acyl-carrier-protein] reductase [Chloroflexota bacterium]